MVTATLVVVDAVASSSWKPPPMTPSPIVGGTTTPPPATSTRPEHPPLEVAGRTGRHAGLGQPRTVENGDEGLSLAAIPVMSAELAVVDVADAMEMACTTVGMMTASMIGMATVDAVIARAEGVKVIAMTAMTGVVSVTGAATASTSSPRGRWTDARADGTPRLSSQGTPRGEDDA